MTDLQETLRSLSSQDLLSLGMSQVAYVKPVSQDGQTSFAIYAAGWHALGRDGQPRGRSGCYSPARNGAGAAELMEA